MNYFLTCIALLIFGIANAQNTMRIAQFQWNSELLHPA
jgi:hypothetical protein